MVGGRRWQLFHYWKQSEGTCFDYFIGRMRGRKYILQKKHGQKQGIYLVPLFKDRKNIKDMLHYKRILRATSLFRLQMTSHYYYIITESF